MFVSIDSRPNRQSPLSVFLMASNPYRRVWNALAGGRSGSLALNTRPAESEMQDVADSTDEGAEDRERNGLGHHERGDVRGGRPEGRGGRREIDRCGCKVRLW